MAYEQIATLKAVYDFVESKTKVDTELSNTSTNPVQNKAINAALAEKSKVILKTWTIADMT